MLVRQLPVGLRRMLGVEDSILQGAKNLIRSYKKGLGSLGCMGYRARWLLPHGLPQLFEGLLAQHAAQGVGRVHHAVHDDVHHVDALRRELRVEALAQHATPRHGCRMGVLPRVAPQRGSGRGHQEAALAPLQHAGQQRLGGTEEAHAGHAPAQLELLQGGVAQRLAAHLSA